MNELHTVVNNVHEHWWIIWGIILCPLWIDLLRAICSPKSRNKIISKDKKLHYFWRLIFYIMFILTILYWVI